MTLGAIISAYQEDDAGGLRALLPLAGQTLVEYQARCLASAGAAPIVALVERVPPALNEAFERLRHEGIAIVAVSDASEAASRFEAGADVLLLADGVAPDIVDLAALVDLDQSRILTVPDDDDHRGFERIDAMRRWAGAARLDANLIGATAAMLGDWDFQSTLLRRAIQSGIALAPATGGEGRGPFLAESDEAMAGFERRLLVASRGQRDDFVARYLLPLVEEVATEKLMETSVRPEWLLYSALALTVGAAFAFTRDFDWVAVLLLFLSLPLDLVAKRLAMLRLRPLHPGNASVRLLWPATGLAWLALGWFEANHDGGWGAMAAAVAGLAFAEAMRIERADSEVPASQWILSRRSAILLAIPFVFLDRWNVFLCLLALYAGVSFFLVQHIRHGLGRSQDA